jgi:hypothetical protein
LRYKSQKAAMARGLGSSTFDFELSTAAGLKASATLFDN